MAQPFSLWYQIYIDVILMPHESSRGVCQERERNCLLIILTCFLTLLLHFLPFLTWPIFSPTPIRRSASALIPLVPKFVISKPPPPPRLGGAGRPVITPICPRHRHTVSPGTYPEGGGGGSRFRPPLKNSLFPVQQVAKNYGLSGGRNFLFLLFLG